MEKAVEGMLADAPVSIHRNMIAFYSTLVAVENGVITQYGGVVSVAATVCTVKL